MPPHPVRSRPTPASPPSYRVLEAIADREGTDPLEFDELLAEALDPDALDGLFRPGQTAGRVEFPYLGYRVVVHADGSVDLSTNGD